jgi:Ca2+-binding RTX toxin-like protein
MSRFVNDLESRVHLTAVIDTSATPPTLVVDGGSNEDIIIVKRDRKRTSKYLVSINGAGSKFNIRDIGAISINGGDGNDHITISDANGVIKVPKSISGGDGNDTLIGNSKGDSINAGAGNDSVLGGGGADTLLGDLGNDVILGGDGDDRIEGGGDSDIAYGDAGDDTLLGQAGNDTLGGDTEDVFRFEGFAAPNQDVGDDRLDGGRGDDHLLGSRESDTIVDDNGRDLFESGKGFDVVDVRGNDVANDVSDNDIVPVQDGSLDADNPVVVVDDTITLTIKINVAGQGEPDDIRTVLIPQGAGSFDSLGEFFAEDNDGTIRFRDVTNRTFTLIEFFRNWGVSFSNTHIGRYVVDANHTLTMKVNGVADTAFGAFEVEDGDDVVIEYARV